MLKTRVVAVGDVALGGEHPIRIQSMTTTDPGDVAGTATQIERLAEAGCEIVRVTTPSLRDAEALGALRRELDRRRLRVPLVADVHFAPNAAMRALEFVEKVRINPGNFSDRKRFEVRSYSDAQYAEELERLADRFRPLARRARELGRALRIGTNHGSLSDRILNRFGDTSTGMVESAIEFLDVCESEGLRDVVFSMKSSNPVVMVDAYRALAARFVERAGPGGLAYPLHLGVTEAGSGRDGRIKSAIGIGTLLAEGLGDTIRVSLTEDPVREVPVARELARRDRRGELAAGRADDSARPVWARAVPLVAADHRATPRRGVVDIEIGALASDVEALASGLSQALASARPLVCEGIVVDLTDDSDAARLPAFVDALRRRAVAAPVLARSGIPPEAAHWKSIASLLFRVRADTAIASIERVARGGRTADSPIEWVLAGSGPRLDARLDRVLEGAPDIAGSSDRFSVESEDPDRFIDDHRRLADRLVLRGLRPDLALRHPGLRGVSDEAAMVHLAADLGSLLGDGFGARISLRDGRTPADALDVIYRVLQGARVRISRAEFISCPSCGRTQFDLESVSARIQRRTAHLRDVKIAIMGCIVNGPGEMADADFGYVGAGPGRIHLYVGREIVARHVPAEEAESRLEQLIRERGRWIDPIDASAHPAQEVR